MRVLVCGGRDFGKCSPGWRSPEHIFIGEYLDKRLNPDNLPLPPDGLVIIAGAATGADTAAIDWAVVNWVSFVEYPANWQEYGKRAGYIRNKQMLEEGKPDLVIAFPGGKGTANMVKLARDAGVPVEIVEYKQ